MHRCAGVSDRYIVILLTSRRDPGRVCATGACGQPAHLSDTLDMSLSPAQKMAATAAAALSVCNALVISGAS